MPVFISHSHQDKDFVDKLAAHLIKHRAYVWVDRWELNVGDSLIQRIQESIQDSSALIVVLSNASIESEWCKKELSAGLMREIEEKKVVVLPVLLDNCKIPLLLKEKLYADFRSNFDEGLSSVIKAVSKFTSSTLGRYDEQDPKYYHDWVLSCDLIEDKVTIEIVALTHSEFFPYSIFLQIKIIGNEMATEIYKRFFNAGCGELAIKKTITVIKEYSDKEIMRIHITDSNEVYQQFIVHDINLANNSHIVHIRCRRLGEDTGMDILYDVKPITTGLYKQYQCAIKDLPEEELRALMALIKP